MKQEPLEEVECNNCGYLMSLTEDESVYVCYNSECTSCYEKYEEKPKQEYYCKACGVSQDEPFGKCHKSHKHCSCEIRLTEEPKQEEDEIIDILDHDGIGNAVDNLNTRIVN